MADTTADIAIIGGGFSGAMLLAELTKRHTSKQIVLIDPYGEAPLGAAYSTRHEEHLLNVPAGKMGAFADDIEGFYRWCDVHLDNVSAQDFVPRRLYGQYLSEIYAQALHANVSEIHASVTGITTDSVHHLSLSDGNIVHADVVVLATGNPFHVYSDPRLIAQPWRYDFASLSGKKFSGPLVIVGSGLTAVDTLISLRKHKVDADIIVVSRNGHFPQVHTDNSGTIALSPAMFAGQPLSVMLYRLRFIVRQAIAQGYSWQAVIDAMRPHTQTLWQHMETRERVRFLRRLKHFWDIHRHRMAPSIGAQLAEAMRSGRVTQIRGRVNTLTSPELTIALRGGGNYEIDAALVFDCTGPRLSVEALPLLSSLLRTGIVSASPVGAGLVMHAPQRVSRADAPAIYAIGPLLIGELLETTAVPELRGQVKLVADAIT